MAFVIVMLPQHTAHAASTFGGVRGGGSLPRGYYRGRDSAGTDVFVEDRDDAHKFPTREAAEKIMAMVVVPQNLIVEED